MMSLRLYCLASLILIGLPCLVQLLTWLHVSRTTIIFGSLKVGSLKISSLALNNNYCFSYRNVFQNVVNALSKMVLKNPDFRQKLKISCSYIQFCSNLTSMWSKYLSNNVWRDFRLPMSALATQERVLTANLLQKLIFRSGISYYHY